MSRRTARRNTQDGPTLAVGYIRVSTQEQAMSGAGLDAQRAAIAQECERRGWELARVYEDEGLSGRDMRRPALQSALVCLASGEASVLVASRLDRISRSVVDFSGLMQRAAREGWSLAVLDVAVDTTSASGEMFATVVASMAQYERRLISERTKGALAAKRAAGRQADCSDCQRSTDACRAHALVVLGRPRVVPHAVKERVRELRAQGNSLRAVADALNAEAVGEVGGTDPFLGLRNAEGRVPTAHGGRAWHPSTVANLLHQG